MIVFGVDPGIATTGWGIVSESRAGRCASRAHGAIYTPAGMSASKRLILIYNAVQEILTQHKPDVMAIEKLFFIQNTSARLGVGQARGVVLLSAEQNNITVVEYAPKIIKQAVTGYGSAGKMQVSHMVKTLLGLSVIPKPDDVADALAVALCHIQSYRLNRVGAGV